MNWEALSNPVVIMAMMLVASMILLIGAAVVGFDKGVLRNMATSDYARGLITYLFAVMTIGTAVVLVLSALLPAADETIADKHFQRGKEILSLLLGVFGTIIGFYFGSSVGSSRAALRLSSLKLTPNLAKVGESIAVQAVAGGGVPPYRFGVGLGNEGVEPKEAVGDDGWLRKELTLHELQSEEPSIVRLVLQDSTGTRVDATAHIIVRPTSTSDIGAA